LSATVIIVHATSNDMKLVHWPLMGGLLHLVQRRRLYVSDKHSSKVFGENATAAVSW